MSWKPHATGMSFGDALEILKDGGRVQRSGWIFWLEIRKPEHDASYIAIDCKWAPLGARDRWRPTHLDLLTSDWLKWRTVENGGRGMTEIQDRHRKAAETAKRRYAPPADEGLRVDYYGDGYAQALADVEDLNGYDLTACRAAYAHVCEAVTPGVGPGGAAAVAISVQQLRLRAERAEKRLREIEVWIASNPDLVERIKNEDEAAERGG